MKCDVCGNEIILLSDEWEVCEVCGDNLCKECIKIHKCKS